MLKILVTGVSGFVGKSLTAQLLLQEHSLCVAVRTTSSLIEDAEVVAVGKIDGETNWVEALKNADVVIHETQQSSHKSFKYLGWHITSMLRFFCSSMFFQVIWRKLTKALTK